jgi:hypothetical protein
MTYIGRFVAALIVSFALVHSSALACRCNAACEKFAAPAEVGPLYPATITYDVAFIPVSTQYPGSPMCGTVTSLTDSLCSIQNPSPCSTMKVADGSGTDVTLPFVFPAQWGDESTLGLDVLTYGVTLTWEQCVAWGTPNGDGTYSLRNEVRVNDAPVGWIWSPPFACERTIVCKPPPPPPPPDQGCTATVGYWKTHAAGGKYDDTWASVGGPGAPFFGSGLTWLQVASSPTRTDKYFIFGRQYVAAVLNGYAGASQDAVLQALAEAEAFFAAHAPGAALPDDVAAMLVRDAALLDGYNNGLAGPPHCD